MKNILLIALFCVLFAPLATAQFYPSPASKDTANYPYWHSMMQDPDANFYATQSAFRKYWDKRTNYRHNGWKVFKRWEYIQKFRVKENGALPRPEELLNEYTRYMDSDNSMSPGGNWTETGPVTMPLNATGQPNGLGRINAVAFHPTNADIIFVGAASGGLWKTVNGGSTWTLLAGTLPAMGVSSILVHPSIPDSILIGTGDRDGDNSQGVGVYRSVNGGVNWTASNTGMGTVTVGMMIRHPAIPAIILAATQTGIFKSINGGSSWELKSSNEENYKDIRFKPGDPTIVYATENGKFYRSDDTGDTWTKITSGIIPGNRMVIGVSPDSPTTVYLCQTNGPFAGLLRSTNSGLSFQTRSTTPNLMGYECNGSDTSNQAYYDLCIAVDPNNANIIYTGGINIWKSTNGGANWNINAHWIGSSYDTSATRCNVASVHADIHSFDWSPVNGKLYTGCDGGVYFTSNGGSAWTEISSGLAISQIYKIGQSTTNQQLVIQGYQDNGTASSIGASFKTVVDGDGMECIIDYSDTNYRYGSCQNGDIFRSNGGWYYKIAIDSINGITEKGDWVTPYILHRTNPSTMFVGAKNVWRSTNVKTDSASKVRWNRISLGDTVLCTVLEQSAANVNIMFVSRGNEIKRTDNVNALNPVWITVSTPDTISRSFVTDIKTHPTDSNIVYATKGKKVYKSVNKGASWVDISGTLPDLPINCIVYNKNSNEGLYIGNQTGVFYKDSTMTNWVLFNSGLPPVDIRELEIFYDQANPSNNKIKAATYGRGLWQSDLYSLPLSLTVTPQNRNVTALAGSTSFAVTSTTAWSAASGELWCNVTPSGVGNGVISVNYDSNTAVNPRTASITVTVAGLNPVIVTVSQSGVEIPTDTTLQDITLTSGQIECYNAMQTIIVAGDDQTFIIQENAGATMIAGQNILFKTGTTVETGGYMHGYIAPSGPWCANLSMPAVIAAEDEITGNFVQSSFKIYPNPTTGNFILELSGDADQVKVDVYGIWGEKVFSEVLGGSRKHKFSLSDRPTGIYFIRVISGDKAETVKVIKQ